MQCSPNTHFVALEEIMKRRVSVTIARSSRLGGAQSEGLTLGGLGDWPRLPLA
jgi:hypothetical protein